eukprot:8019192-Pyramimonas_sp.AAC.1
MQALFHQHRPVLLWACLFGPPTTGQFTRSRRRWLQLISQQRQSGGLKTTMVRLQDGSHTSTIRLEANFDLGAPGMVDNTEAPAAVASPLD